MTYFVRGCSRYRPLPPMFFRGARDQVVPHHSPLHALHPNGAGERTAAVSRDVVVDPEQQPPFSGRHVDEARSFAVAEVVVAAWIDSNCSCCPSDPSRNHHIEFLSNFVQQGKGMGLFSLMKREVPIMSNPR